MNDNIKKIIKFFIPISILRTVKAKIDNRKIKQIEKYKIEKFDKNYTDRGFNIIASIRHEIGLGESSRIISKIVEASGIDYTIKNIDFSDKIADGDHSLDYKISDKLEYGINLVHINMHALLEGLEIFGKENLNKRYNIAYWLWEMEEFPKEWVPFIHLFDEIWTPAEFISKAIRKVTDKKVCTIPYYIKAETAGNIDRKYFGLPEDKFLYLMMFDSKSILERKNPRATIESFKKAFKSSDKRVALVIKINNSQKQEMRKIREALKGYDVYFINRIYPRKELNSLISLVDVYVSLHRAEGFGLILAEAMYLGTPTIATNYSANTEFQDEASACLVEYKKIKVGKGQYPYKKEYEWADADTDVAAVYMKKLLEDKEYYTKISKNAKKHIEEVLNIERSADLVRDRFESIYKIEV